MKNSGPRPGAFFATAAKGTEPAVRDELRRLRFRGVRADRGGVHFDGTLYDGIRACLLSQTSMRVLMWLATFEARTGDELYEGVRSIDWTTHLSPRTTLAVRASVRSSAMTHSQFIGQKTKDAIVDAIREAKGNRPSVDREDPDAVVSVHLAKDLATVYLDVSGNPLFTRGYRLLNTGAPLKETLAASLLYLSGWGHERGALLDPMCGSGTIVIEAALLATGRAPGILTPRVFGFERWASFGAEERKWTGELRSELQERSVRSAKDTPDIIGRDMDERALTAARENAVRAGVHIRFERADVRDLRAGTCPGDNGECTILANPPYGERIAMPKLEWLAAGAALTKLGQARLGLLLGHPDMLEALCAREPDRVITVMNGDIECGFAVYDPPREGHRPGS